MSARPTHSMRTSGRPGGCLATSVFAALFVAGTLILYLVFWQPIRQAVEALRWRETPCRILRSEVVTPVERGGLAKGAYRAEIVYEYHANKVRYENGRIYFIEPDAMSIADARRLVERYPAGLRTTCYVEPGRPRNAVLERGFKPTLLVALAPLLLAVVGGAGLLWQVIGSMRWSSGGSLPDLTPGEGAGGGGAGAAASGPVTRRGKTGCGGLIFILIFAAIWNFVVSFLGREVLDQWKGGPPGCHGWFLTLFAVPFVLIGLGLAVAPVYFFLKLFNPRPTVAFSKGAVPVGGSFEIAWRFSGSAHRIRRLSIRVEAREEATYRRGTDTTTDRETFLTIPLVEATRADEVRLGRATVTIPAGAMPTFKARNNKVVWALKMVGEIPRWPDVDEEFEFDVLPAEAAEAAESPAAGDAAGTPGRDEEDAGGPGPATAGGDRLLLRLEGGRTRFRPGEAIKGQAAWRFEQPPAFAQVQLCWATRGKGTVDSGVVATAEVEAPPAVGGLAFSLAVPRQGPYSFSGKLVSVIWFVKAYVKPSKETVELPVTISPTGAEIALVRE